MDSLISREWIVSAIRDYIAEAKDAHYEMAAEVATAVETIRALPLVRPGRAERKGLTQ